MKNVGTQMIFLASTLGMIASTGAWADGSGLPSPANGGPFPAPELVKIPADDLFAPPGFDDNDNVQVVVHGQLINTCYKVAPPTVNVDRAHHLITVSAQAYVYPGCWCLQVLVPFTQTIDLGILPAGHYQVVEYNKAGTLIHQASLPVSVAITSNPDDALYAPVKNAKVDLGAPGSAKTLVLGGTFSSDCMELQEVKVLHRLPNIIEVLPIAAYKTGSECKPSPQPFEARVTLPETVPGDTLIYVRSLNGQALSIVEPF